jgi:predicted dithiol-disulfide oxidoreductase (DUF899 family)
METQIRPCPTSKRLVGATEEHAGLSAFAAEIGIVYHTYSCCARGSEAFNIAYQLLDCVTVAATNKS